MNTVEAKQSVEIFDWILCWTCEGGEGTFECIVCTFFVMHQSLRAGRDARA